jgi:hypothetical protein
LSIKDRKTKISRLLEESGRKLPEDWTGTTNEILSGYLLTDKERDILASLKGDLLEKKYPHNVFHWSGTDNEEHYQTLADSHRQYWDSKELTYKLNSYGMRCDEPPDNHPNSILFLGCSNTFGLGEIKERTFASLVSTELGKHEVNCGVPGGSLDAAFRLYSHWQPIVRAGITVIAVPPGWRFEHLYHFRENKIVISPQGGWSAAKDNTLLNYPINFPNHFISTKRNLNAILNIARETDSKVFATDYRSPDILEIIDTAARDGKHFGHKVHRFIADKIKESISKDETFNL